MDAWDQLPRSYLNRFPEMMPHSEIEIDPVNALKCHEVCFQSLHRSIIGLFDAVGTCVP